MAYSILLVDDNAELLKLATYILRAHNYSVHPVTNSLEALKHFKRTPTSFDLLITDLNMPNLNGHELSRQIATIRPDLPILLISASGLYDYNCINQYGIDATVLKPYRQEKLIRAVEQLLTAAAAATKHCT